MNEEIDWFKYDEDFEKITGYKDLRMLSLYDHFLTNKEAEDMITYVHGESNIISLEFYQEAEKKYLNLFEELYDLFGAKVLDSQTMSLYDFRKTEYLSVIQKACREIKDCIIILPKEKIVFMSTYDLLFVVLFYSDYPKWINNQVLKERLFLLRNG